MTETKKNTNKETIWLSILTVLPVALLWPTSEYFTEPGLNRTLLSGLFGGLGGLIGYGIYSFVRTKTDKTKILTATGILVVGIGFILTLDNFVKQDFQTCEVCGYKAVDINKSECNYCASQTWGKEKSFGLYDNKEEWLRDQQLFWFGLDEISEKANFYEPTVDEGFKKDKNWKPIITQEDLINDLENE